MPAAPIILTEPYSIDSNDPDETIPAGTVGLPVHFGAPVDVVRALRDLPHPNNYHFPTCPGRPPGTGSPPSTISKPFKPARPTRPWNGPTSVWLRLGEPRPPGVPPVRTTRT